MSLGTNCNSITIISTPDSVFWKMTFALSILKDITGQQTEKRDKLYTEKYYWGVTELQPQVSMNLPWHWGKTWLAHPRTLKEVQRETQSLQTAPKISTGGETGYLVTQ